MSSVAYGSSSSSSSSSSVSNGGVSGASLAERALDVESEDLTNTNPIVGLLRAEVLPLDEAMFLTPLPDMSMHIRAARFHAKNMIEGQRGKLQVDEAASIHLYTQESPLYRKLNGLLRQRDRQSLKSYFSFLRLIISALFKLPAKEETLFRGVKGNISGKFHALKGRTCIWWGFSSCSTDQEVMMRDEFCGQDGARTMFIIQAKYARDITPFSAIPNENEALLLPGAQLVVKAVSNMGANLHVVHLVEADTPWILGEFEKPATPAPAPSPAIVSPRPESRPAAPAATGAPPPINPAVAGMASAPIMQQPSMPPAVYQQPSMGGQPVPPYGGYVQQPQVQPAFDPYGYQQPYANPYAYQQQPMVPYQQPAAPPGYYPQPSPMFQQQPQMFNQQQYPPQPMAAPIPQVLSPAAAASAPQPSMPIQPPALSKATSTPLPGGPPQLNKGVSVPPTPQQAAAALVPSSSFGKSAVDNKPAALNRNGTSPPPATPTASTASSPAAAPREVPVINPKSSKMLEDRGKKVGHFDEPHQIAISYDKIFIADGCNERIQVLDLRIQPLYQWGRQGKYDGQFASPFGVAVTAEEVYVSDTFNHRVQVFSARGVFSRKWGDRGHAPGYFNSPRHLAFFNNILYVADGGNGRVQAFRSDGALLGCISGKGDAAGQMKFPFGIAVCKDSIFVSDWDSKFINVFRLDNGFFVRRWKCEGTPAGLFAAEMNAGVHVAVCNYSMKRIDVFTETGELEAKFVTKCDPNGIFVNYDGMAYVTEQGSGHGLEIFKIARTPAEISAELQAKTAPPPVSRGKTSSDGKKDGEDKCVIQ